MAVVRLVDRVPAGLCCLARTCCLGLPFMFVTEDCRHGLLSVFLWSRWTGRWTGRCLGGQGQLHGGSSWSARDCLLLVCILIITVVDSRQMDIARKDSERQAQVPVLLFMLRLVSCRQSYVLLLGLTLQLEQFTLTAHAICWLPFPWVYSCRRERTSRGVGAVASAVIFGYSDFCPLAAGFCGRRVHQLAARPL